MASVSIGVSVEQVTALLDFLENHKELALGRLTRTKEGRSLTKRLWAECADTLNSVSSNCVPKTPDQWRVYYNEYKSKLLKKIKLQKAEIGATGGGPSKQTPLTPLQERLYNILGRDVGEPLPGIRHNPLCQLEVVEDAVPLARPLSVEYLDSAEQEGLVVIEVAGDDYSPSRDPFASTDRELATGTPAGTNRECIAGPTSSTSRELASDNTAGTSRECAAGPTTSTSRELATGNTAGTSRECTTGPTHSTSRDIFPVATDSISQARPIAPRRRRRRRSPISHANQATENEPAMRKATERLESMERLNAEATRELAQATHRLAEANAEATLELAQATHRQAAALEALAEGVRVYIRELQDRRRSPQRRNRMRRNQSDSD